MTRRFILGSGIVGLLARAILGPEWTLLPFKRSRFFSWAIPLDDNFLAAHAELDPLIADLTRRPPTRLDYLIGWSTGGQVVRRHDRGLCLDWLTNVFGVDYPRHAEPYMATRGWLPIYDVRLNLLYAQLQHTYEAELKAQAALGDVTRIAERRQVVGGQQLEYDQIVSTIPLDALLQLLGLTTPAVKARPLHYFCLETDHFNFEGCNQLLAADAAFPFYKATRIGQRRYVFHCHQDVPQPGPFFMAVVPGNFDLIAGTRVDGALPLGQMPNLDGLREFGVWCVGSYAEWDWCADVGSCVLRLLRFAGRGCKPRDVHSVGI